MAEQQEGKRRERENAQGLAGCEKGGTRLMAMGGPDMDVVVPCGRGGGRRRRREEGEEIELTRVKCADTHFNEISFASECTSTASLLF